MKILLTGSTGQVGWELQRTLAPFGDITALKREDLDLTILDDIRSKVRFVKPDLIINAAAYNDVEGAESEFDLAMAVNGIAPGILAEEAKLCGAVLIHYSTDYLFDGSNKKPYTELDSPNPLNAYGKTKLAGELAVLAAGAAHIIIRTSWVYGLRGQNFFLKIQQLATGRSQINVVNDQVGCPTWCRDIAEVTALILHRHREKLLFLQDTLNVSSNGQASWYDFAVAIISRQDAGSKGCQVKAVSSSEYQTRAKRPFNSVLSTEKLTTQYGIIMPTWYKTLRLVLEEQKLYQQFRS